MRNPLSDTIVQIPPSGIRKFFDIVSEMKDAISLGVGEPDFDTPWHIREEGIYSLERGRTFYTSNAGLKELKEEISRYIKRRCNVLYDYAGEVMVTVGGSEAIDIALRAMINPGAGEEVLIPQPSYVSYVPCTILAGGVPVVIELEAKDEFRLTPEKLLPSSMPDLPILTLPACSLSCPPVFLFSYFLFSCFPIFHLHFFFIYNSAIRCYTGQKKDGTNK